MFAQILSFWRPEKSYPFANFSILDFDGSTGTNSSLLPKMTFVLKMTKFTLFSSAKGKYFLLHKYRSFQVQIVDTSFISKTLCVDIQIGTSKTQKTEFYQPSRPILAHSSLIQGSSKRSRVQIFRFIANEKLMMPTHSARSDRAINSFSLCFFFNFLVIKFKI